MRYVWRKMPVVWLAGALALLLAVSCFCGLLLGYLPLSVTDVWSVLLYKAGAADGVSLAPGIADAVWDLRMPRVLLAAAVGMGLSLSGILMQAMFKNPMADPYIMGISSGASLGAACTVFLGIGTSLGAGSIGVGAFCGAVVLSAVVALAAGWTKGTDMSYFLIFGVALSAVCGGITSVLIYLGANSSGMDVTLYWLMGSVSSAKSGPVLFLLGIVILCSLFFSTQSRILNLMLEGEEAAVPLGRSLVPFFRLYLLLNALLTGCIVMNAGLIGFVGLLVPHGMRMLMGADHRRLLPAAVLMGGVISVWADILGRTLIRGADIPLGVTLAMMGAPFFVVLVVRRSYRFGGDV